MRPVTATSDRSTRAHKNGRFVGLPVLVAFVFAATIAITTSGSSAEAEADPVPVDVESGAPTGSASAFTAINPQRVLDTRRNDAVPRLWVESAISIDPISGTGVAEAAGVDPDDVTAVVVNVTMINAGSGGFGSVWPTGSTRLQTSTNNVEFAGHTIPNLVIAPLGLERKISVFASTTSDITVDVLGVFTRSEATTGGRYESIEPTRAFDTRSTDTDNFTADETRVVDLTSAGVPANATGVVMNVTAIRSNGAGFYRVWSAGQTEPSHSSVNVLGVDYQAGNQVISGVENGMVNVSTNVGGGLTMDVTGYFTGDDPEAEPTTEGLYVPFTPGRLLDSRATSGETSLTDGDRLEGDTPLDIEVFSRLDLPEAGVKAVAFNLTAVRADARGFVSVFASDATAPSTSSLNFTTGGQTVPNHAITSVGEAGSVRVLASQDTHLLIDASGYFLDADATPPAASSAVERVVEPGDFVPEPLTSSPIVEGPYDFLFDRGAFSATGVRPNPTVRAVWPTCAVVRYALNIDLAESDEQVAVVIESIEEMERYSGLDFQFAGITSSGMNIDDPILLAENFNPQLGPRLLGEDPAPFKYLPQDPNGNDSVSLVIGFSNNDDTIELRSRGTIGVGGSLRTQQNYSGFAESLRGFAIVDLSEIYVDGPSGPATLANIKATTTHEIGHMMGLGHVSDFDPRTGTLSTAFQGLDANSGSWSDAVMQDQLMYPALNPNAGVSFDTGDQLGLWDLYNQSFCPAGKDGQKQNDVDWSSVEVVKSDDDFG